MPFNVSYLGKHIGFVARTYSVHKQLLLIALTSLRVEDVGIDMDQLKSFLGRTYDTTDFFGRVKEAELRKVMEIEQQEKYSHLGIDEYEDFLRFSYMKIAGRRISQIENLFNWNLINEKVEGYLIFDVEKAKMKDNTIILEEEIDYFSEERLNKENGVPIFAVVNDYPLIRTDVMGAGEGLLLGANFSDFGGRNHSHETVITIKSGNSEHELTLPIQMPVKKGMPIQFYLKENDVHKIFYDGMIYEL